MVLQLRIQHLLSVLVKANNIIKKKNQLVCHLPLEFITLACIVLNHLFQVLPAPLA